MQNTIVFYQSEKQNVTVNVTYLNESFWLSQKMIAQLFNCSIDNVSLHLKNIFNTNELNPNSVIEEFSVTASEYDKSTKELFEKKKNTLILSEQMKADRQKEIENRLMIVEKGLREKAEAEAIANVDKTKAVIEGQKKTEVAEMQKKEAEVVANRQLEVAKIEKTEQETKANMSLEVAKINRMAAEEDAKRIITLAKAEQDKISLAGALTEHDRVLAEISARRDIEVADKLSKIQVPANLMIGGNAEKSGSDFQGTLMNMILLKNLGILKDAKEESVVLPVVAPVAPVKK
jgi:membrane protein involved in colicin uptake